MVHALLKDSFQLLLNNHYLSKKKLELSTNKWLLSAQGNGISDEYTKCETVHTLFYSFLENTFKIKFNVKKI